MSTATKSKRPPPKAAPTASRPMTAKLRLLATTDLHMHLTAHNFVTDEPSLNPGLAGIATLISQARAEAAEHNSACALFDNGDLLQGTALGDWQAQLPVTTEHPAVACLEAIGYDAVGVGNHDLDYGVPYLRAVANRMSAPMVASNLDADDLSPLTPAALIPCRVPAKGCMPEQVLHLGVLSVLPEQTALWNHHLLDGVVTICPSVERLRAAVPALRARGADLVILLAHMGLGQDSEGDDTALPLAQIPGIDAMITGHTHRRFPGLDHVNTGGVDIETGTIKQVPAIMPGHSGSDLAVLDLTLTQTQSGAWQVIGHYSQLRRNVASTLAAPTVLKATAVARADLRKHLSVVAGQTPETLHNFFASATPTSICALTARAKARLARIGLQGRPEAQWPLIVATAAHTAGGRDGPGNFLHVPKGPVLRRHLAGMNPYSNQIWALWITGAELRARLEHAATIFTQLSPDRPDALLCNPNVPVFNFDTIFGPRYIIDPTSAPGDRIASLTYRDQKVAPDDRFVLVTNQFRAAGGGGYAPLPSERIIMRSPSPLEEGLSREITAPTDPGWHVKPWAIVPSQTVCATIHTSPAALDHLRDIAHLAPEIGAQTEDGFTPIRLTY